MEWIIHLLRQHSELAIFLTIAAGFWIGKMRIKQFSLGIVTSVLLVGVLVGQLNITIEEPVKSVFFLLFLFAIGYKVGPQFFRGLKKDGLPQVGFAVLMCVGCLVITWLLATLMGYNAGETAGLLAGAQTISAVIGVAEDTINGLNIASSQKSDMINIIPVAYAVTYIFGTAGSAWVLSGEIRVFSFIPFCHRIQSGTTILSRTEKRWFTSSRIRRTHVRRLFGYHLVISYLNGI